MRFQEITVDTATLESDICELREALESARNQLGMMFDDVAELDAMWDGPANDEFKRQFGIDHDNAQKMCDAVGALIESMEFARDRYDRCEGEVRDIIAGIAI